MTDNVIEDVTGLVLAVQIRAHQGKRDELVALLREAMEPTVGSEPGCAAAAMHVSLTDPDLIFVYEHYDSEDAFQEHLANYDRFAVYGEVRSSLRALLAERMVVDRFTPIARYQRP